MLAYKSQENSAVHGLYVLNSRRPVHGMPIFRLQILGLEVY
jgi:hypothetical protein